MSKGKMTYLLIGATAGAAIGVLLSTNAGKEIRNKISGLTGGLVDMLMEKANNALQSTSDLSNRANDSVQETVSNLKSKVDRSPSL
jgi:gas vesicle protein